LSYARAISGLPYWIEALLIVEAKLPRGQGFQQLTLILSIFVHVSPTPKNLSPPLSRKNPDGYYG
jgi:hypothetical protein